MLPFYSLDCELANWLQSDYKLSSSDVAAVLGSSIQYNISEVADRNVGVVAKISKKALAFEAGRDNEVTDRVTRRALHCPSCYDCKMHRCAQALRLGTLLFVVAAAVTVQAQQQPKPKDLPDSPSPKQVSGSEKHENRFETTVGILGRRSIFFPDLAASPGPLSSKQKLELFADKSIAPSRVLSSALGAGIGQARDSLPGYGQGIGGYGQRFGSSMATGASSEFFGTFLFASLFHRDPRYFVILRGGPWHRISYGVSRLLVARTDAGKEGANWPGVLGPLFAESLANSYLPVKEQTAGRTFSRYGVRLGFTAGTNVLKEYWPSIFRSLRIAKIAPGLHPDSPPAPPGMFR